MNAQSVLSSFTEHRRAMRSLSYSVTQWYTYGRPKAPQGSIWTMVGSKQEILTYLKTQKDHLREKYHVRRVAVIGSFARDEQSATSDIDLLLDLEEGTANIFEIKRTLTNQFERDLGRPVELASERYLKPYYKEEILREAIYI